jgi:glycosyltransferase involved in cell wall biosynthesis
VFTVAGEGPVDVVLPGLRIGAPVPPSREELSRALRGANLVIVENLASLPLNLAARDAVYAVLEGRPALFHHHDLPWQRPHLAHLAGPLSGPTWHHVTINDLSRRELEVRGITATALPNTFDCDPPLGDRERTRLALGATDHERLALVPTRAIPRKNVAGALRLARDLGATLWLLGPSEDGFEPELQRVLHAFDVPVRRGAPDGVSIHDAYAACDVVVMASLWEGFGNPTLESVTHQRPLALYPYPVSGELRANGLRFFALDDVSGLARELSAPDLSRRAANLDVARRHYNVKDLPSRLAPLLAAALGRPRE